MLRVGIIGADEPQGGHLIRLLLTHPEVDIVSLMAPDERGKRISAVHYGMIGETDLMFTDHIDFEKINVLFVLSPLPLPELPEDIKVIDLTMRHPAEQGEVDVEGKSLYEFGLSEVNRKSLVRGATRAYIPLPVASAALVALGPLALHLLLSDYIDMSVTSPGFAVETQELDDSVRQIKRVLGNIQTSFEGEIRVNAAIKGESARGMRITMTFPTSMTVGDIKDIFEGIYDDHNFTFLTDNPVDTREVEGTNRCILYVSSPSEGKISVEIVADATMRGGVGDAIHVMNLLNGLHEKTGLYLPAI